MSIFVSIASFRDADCKDTLRTLFENATRPENVFVGICEQNDPGTEKESCHCIDKWNAHVRKIRLHFRDARGPTYARHLCASLWAGEDYFLQLDSHMALVPGWDIKMIGMLTKLQRETGNSKNVLSTYADLYENYAKYISGDKNVIDNAPRICQAFMNDRKMISFHGAHMLPRTPTPVRNAFVAGGFLFVESKPFFDLVPQDPWLSEVFVGEEILLSARLYTNGFDVYTPSENLVFHKFGREDSPKYWDTKIDDTDGLQRVKYILGMSDTPGPLNKNLDRYGLGKERSLSDFFDFAGIDPQTGRVHKSFCPGDLIPDPDRPVKRVSRFVSCVSTLIAVCVSILVIRAIRFYPR